MRTSIFTLSINKFSISFVYWLIIKGQIQIRMQNFKVYDRFKSNFFFIVLTSSFPFIRHIFTSGSFEYHVSFCCSFKSTILKLYTKFLQIKKKLISMVYMHIKFVSVGLHVLCSIFIFNTL